MPWNISLYFHIAFTAHLLYYTQKHHDLSHPGIPTDAKQLCAESFRCLDISNTGGLCQHWLTLRASGSVCGHTSDSTIAAKQQPLQLSPQHTHNMNICVDIYTSSAPHDKSRQLLVPTPVSVAGPPHNKTQPQTSQAALRRRGGRDRCIHPVSSGTSLEVECLDAPFIAEKAVPAT